MPYDQGKLLTRASLRLLVRGLASLAVGGTLGTLLLVGYWMLNRPTADSSAFLADAFAFLIALPIALSVAIPLASIMGVAPMYFLAAVLEATFRLSKLHYKPVQGVIGAGVGGLTGYWMLNTNIEFWGDAVPGALFGASIMLSWVLLGPTIQKFVLHPRPERV